ncbi:MAG: putative kinase, aspartokinase/uridylate kinase [Planctomycetaceae bacterium]|nr:putative kinase, aspartokinase/uridylate kinase [Planctomycetaceae bacterium]
MSLPPVVAYKVGGSLFSLPDLPDRLRQVWRERPGTSPLLIVGGGAAADAVRDWDRTFQFGDDVAHWLAIDALDLSASLLMRLMPELQLVRNRKQLELAQLENRPAVLCVVCFVKWLETQPTPLPHSWDVTSDSIAAAAAVVWQAEELVLLKSCDSPESIEPSALATQGLVDQYFSIAARNLRRLTWVNLRSTGQ